MISKTLLESMRNSHSGSSGGSYTPILDAYGQPYSAWSYLKLHSSFSGTVRIRESTGGTETEISYGSDGYLDASAIDSHLSGGAGTVVDVDNQGTAGGSMANSTTSTQPAIVDSDIISGQKGFSFGGKTLVQDFGSNVVHRNTFDHFIVFRPVNATPFYYGIYGQSRSTSQLAQLRLLMSISNDTQWRNYLNSVYNHIETGMTSFYDKVCVAHFYRDAGPGDANCWINYDGNTYSGTFSVPYSLNEDRYVQWSGERINSLASTFYGEMAALIMYQGTALSSSDRTGIRSALQTQFQ